MTLPKNYYILVYVEGCEQRRSHMERDIFVPGRTELAGNHTDHQRGRILASAVDLGLFASFWPNGSNLCHIESALRTLTFASTS